MLMYRSAVQATAVEMKVAPSSEPAITAVDAVAMTAADRRAVQNFEVAKQPIKAEKKSCRRAALTAGGRGGFCSSPSLLEWCWAS